MIYLYNTCTTHIYTYILQMYAAHSVQEKKDYILIDMVGQNKKKITLTVVVVVVRRNEHTIIILCCIRAAACRVWRQRDCSMRAVCINQQYLTTVMIILIMVKVIITIMIIIFQSGHHNNVVIRRNCSVLQMCTYCFSSLRREPFARILASRTSSSPSQEIRVRPRRLFYPQ